MEPFYYTKMTKQQQAAYHVIMQGANALADEFQIPRIEIAELYDVFFRLRLDHPEIFWMTGYKYKYYQDSPNLIFVPEYLFDKNKIREHQRADRRSSGLLSSLEPVRILSGCLSLPEKGYILHPLGKRSVQSHFFLWQEKSLFLLDIDLPFLLNHLLLMTSSYP